MNTQPSRTQHSRIRSRDHHVLSRVDKKEDVAHACATNSGANFSQHHLQSRCAKKFEKKKHILRQCQGKRPSCRTRTNANEGENLLNVLRSRINFGLQFLPYCPKSPKSPPVCPCAASLPALPLRKRRHASSFSFLTLSSQQTQE